MATPKEDTPPTTETVPKPPAADPNNKDTDELPPIELSPELQELEKRLNKTMLHNIATSIEAALKPIKDSIDKIVMSSDLIVKQEEQIKNLTEENVKLKDELLSVRSDISSFKSRLTELENKALECNLIFRGIEESLNETDECLREKIYWNVANMIDQV